MRKCPKSQRQRSLHVRKRSLGAYDDMFDVLNKIVAAFEADPRSTQCFSTSIVHRATQVVRYIKLKDPTLR